LQIQALLTQDEVTRAHSSLDAAGLLFEQIKSRPLFSSTSTKGKGSDNIHLTPIDRLPFHALKSRSAKCTTFSLSSMYGMVFTRLLYTSHFCMTGIRRSFCTTIFIQNDSSARRFP
ncbi:hypothetical protein JG688_00017249, partial [Phytophthora aleatoria]